MIIIHKKGVGNMLENNQQTIVEKNKSVVEIDLKKGEKRKLNLFGF